MREGAGCRVMPAMSVPRMEPTPRADMMIPNAAAPSGRAASAKAVQQSDQIDQGNGDGLLPGGEGQHEHQQHAHHVGDDHHQARREAVDHHSAQQHEDGPRHGGKRHHRAHDEGVARELQDQPGQRDEGQLIAGERDRRTKPEEPELPELQRLEKRFDDGSLRDPNRAWHQALNPGVRLCNRSFPHLSLRLLLNRTTAV